ncbi:MAG: carboxymuconolactone decarboxylase family protein [Simkaniaceae bacterium]|nr:carboxymuconolactone decarboxylase family protein [Candidatus Sacchlamyda saccharinae]
MSRISPKPLDQYPWTLRLLYWYQRRKYGEPLLPSLLWGRMPKLLMLFFGFIRFFERKKSPLDPVLRSRVMLRVSETNKCPFCIDINSSALQQKNAGDPSAREECALFFAEAVTDTTKQVDDALFASLNEHFSEEEIAELAALIAFQNMSSKFNSALNVEPHGFCKINRQ